MGKNVGKHNIAKPVQVSTADTSVWVMGRVAMSDIKRFVLSLPGPEVGRYSLKKDFKTGKLSKWADGSCASNLQVGFYSLEGSPEVANYTWSWGQKTLRRLVAFADSYLRPDDRRLHVYVSVLPDTHSQLKTDDYNGQWVERVLSIYDIRSQGGTVDYTDESVEEPMD